MIARLPALLTRRALLPGAATAILARPAAATAGLPVPPTGTLAFKAFRNGSPLGSHELRFAQSGDTLVVTIAVDYRVKLGPIPVFHYTLRATETWRAGRIAEMRADIDDNGTQTATTLQRVADGLLVEGAKSGKYTAPANALPASHWNRHELDGPMINPDGGELMQFTVADRGAQPIKGADGVSIPATRFDLIGPDHIDLWYDADQMWCGLQAVVKDNSVVTYERT